MAVITRYRSSDATTDSYRFTFPIVCEYVPPNPDEIIKEQKRKQKHIDRLAWEGERRQRYQKGGHWK